MIQANESIQRLDQLDGAERSDADFTATRNACKLCTPLGACLAFAGVEGAVPFLHGSQGCATYIRRYMISHFREPMDIASSSFGEHATIFGGRDNLRLGLANVIEGYAPSLIGIATTCLSETIGDDVAMLLHEFKADHEGEAMPEIVHVSTPSYAGTHAEGYIATLRSIVEQLVPPTPRTEPGHGLNLIPGMVSPADLRRLRRIAEDFDIEATLVPDYADRMDGPSWAEYKRIPEGGTPIEAIRRMGRAALTVEMAATAPPKRTAGAWLEQHCGVPVRRMPLPIGIGLSDALFTAMAECSGRSIPERYTAERGRLIDAYVDAHKYLSGKRAIVLGEEDMIVSIVSFLAELGVEPVLVATGGHSGRLKGAIADVAPAVADHVLIRDDSDYEAAADLAAGLSPDVIIGPSKGYTLARRINVPLLRVGFPVHDRFGGARLSHLAYAGTQQLLDRLTNVLLDHRQAESQVGFTYL